VPIASSLKAYRRAAQTLEALPESVSGLVQQGSDLTQLPLIGKAISQVSVEIVNTANWLDSRKPLGF